MPGRFRAEALLFEGGGVTVLASTTGVASRCPSCGRLSRRTHSRYARTVAALPTGGAEGDATEDVGAPGLTTPNRPRLWYARQEEAARKRHERLVERWKAIRRLYLAGADLRDICKRLGVSARTV